jgi:hypothetical protein
MLDAAVPITLHQGKIVRSRDLQAFAAELGSRLLAGSHLILYGPRGVGKSTLLSILSDHCRAGDTPCGIAPSTSGLPDIVSALARAYPGTDIAGLGKRAARIRLRGAADRISGVLLLDHATAMTTAMLGYLRRLRGGIVGALLVADIDTPHERERMRAWHAGALSLRMPPTSNPQLHRLLMTAMRSSNLPKLEPKMARQIIRAARGRIGWLDQCMQRMEMPEYWLEARLHLAALCTDTEIALRQSRRGPRMLRRH